MQRDGLTLVPTKMYFKKGKAKIEIAVAKGKNNLIKEPLKRTEIGIVKKPDTLENQAKHSYLAIGSNLGNKISNINLAKFELEKNKIKILKTSSFYLSKSWPNPLMPSFINIVVKVETNFAPLELLNVCNLIELNWVDLEQ